MFDEEEYGELYEELYEKYGDEYPEGYKEWYEDEYPEGWSFEGAPIGALDVELGDLESGDFEQSTTVTSEGKNSNQAAPVLNAANTGNVQNVQGVWQYASEADDIEFEGSSIEVSPDLTFSGDQAVEQAAVAE